MTDKTETREQLLIEPDTRCRHEDTEAGEHPRWRWCLDCFQTVQRSETGHYRRLSS